MHILASAVCCRNLQICDLQQKLMDADQGEEHVSLVGGLLCLLFITRLICCGHVLCHVIVCVMRRVMCCVVGIVIVCCVTTLCVVSCIVSCHASHVMCRVSYPACRVTEEKTRCKWESVRTMAEAKCGLQWLLSTVSHPHTPTSHPLHPHAPTHPKPPHPTHVPPHAHTPTYPPP